MSAAPRALRHRLARLPAPPRAARSRPRLWRAVTTSSRCCSSATPAWGSRACCCASRCAACRRPALCGALPASRRPATRPPTRRRATAGVQVRGGLPLDHRRGLCARRPAPRPAAALALSVACWLRATLRKSGPWRSTARRSSSSWCARPPRARTATARAAASAGPLASSAHGCRLLLRAAVGHCRAGALPDDHEQLLPREPGHHDRVRRDRPPVRALGAPCWQ